MWKPDRYCCVQVARHLNSELGLTIDVPVVGQRENGLRCNAVAKFSR